MGLHDRRDHCVQHRWRRDLRIHREPIRDGPSFWVAGGPVQEDILYIHDSNANLSWCPVCLCLSPVPILPHIQERKAPHQRSHSHWLDRLGNHST
jgi:hypothetical protein